VRVNLVAKGDAAAALLGEYDLDKATELDRLARDLGKRLIAAHDAVANARERMLQTVADIQFVPELQNRNFGQLVLLAEISFLKDECMLHRRIVDAFMFDGRLQEALQHLLSDAAVSACKRDTTTANGFPYRRVVITKGLARLNSDKPELVKPYQDLIARFSEEAADRERGGEYFPIAVVHWGMQPPDQFGGARQEKFERYTREAAAQSKAGLLRGSAASREIYPLLSDQERDILNRRMNLAPPTNSDPVPARKQVESGARQRIASVDFKKPQNSRRYGTTYRCKVITRGGQYRIQRCFR
jgi:hypothetical protein